MYLGLNAFFHDSSASLVDSDGQIIAAVEEERFTRIKRESRFPIDAIRCCLRIAGATIDDVEGIGFPWDPSSFLMKRILWSNLLQYPAPPAAIWKNLTKLYRMRTISGRLCAESASGEVKGYVRYYRHHLSHAASAYYPSPFDEAAYLTFDGRGELECTTWGICRGSRIQQLGSAYFPDSIGKLYSAVCRFLGFQRPEKDGTVMALAGCGEPAFLPQFREMFFIDPTLGLNGVRLRRRYFKLYDQALPSSAMEKLLRVKVRRSDEEITQVHKDIAATLQHVTQEAVLYLVRELHHLTRVRNIVLSGGVALNSVANGMILQRSPFTDLFIQPAAHDGGLSLGAALLLAHDGKTAKRDCRFRSAALGPEYGDDDIKRALDEHLGNDLIASKPDLLAAHVAELLAQGMIVAVFNGRMEFGPRALGHRSILADPRKFDMQKRLNDIKSRESFRPFAASVLQEKAAAWLCHTTHSPYMLLVDRIEPKFRRLVPGVQHEDGTVRVQTVRRDVDPLLHGIISEFFRLTEVPLVLNTSLNIRGEPLACTPDDALRTFKAVELDAMVLGSYLVTKTGSVARRITPSLVVG